MDGIALQKTLANRLHMIARTCLRLELEPGEQVAEVPESGFGGRPWWPVDEAWPVCDSCGQSLAFICQVRLDGGGHWRPGAYDLLSVFFCPRCGQQEDAGLVELPGGDGCRLRLMRLRDQPLALQDPPPDLSARGRLMPCRVHGVPMLDTPAWQDVVDELAGLAPKALNDFYVSYHLAEVEVLRRAGSVPQNQLGGYPHWVGSQSCWPECRWCGGQMYLLAQFVPTPSLEFPWGAGGRAYFFCCAEPCDPEALTLVLQS